MTHPSLAEALNPRIALARREAEAMGEAAPAPTPPTPSPNIRFEKARSPAEKARQRALLEQLLRQRDAARQP